MRSTYYDTKESRLAKLGSGVWVSNNSKAKGKNIQKEFDEPGSGIGELLEGAPVR